MQPNGTGNGLVGSLKSVFSIANPIIMIVAAAIVWNTNTTVHSAVDALRQEMEKQIAAAYESRETATISRASMQERIEHSQREHDELRRLIEHLDERVRAIETRR